MDFHVSLDGGRPLSAEVYRQLRAAILDGRLRLGDPLPATRELAARLAVSRNTVINAYQRLTAEGYLAGRAGSGTFVAAVGGSAQATRRAPAGALAVPRSWQALIEPSQPATAEVLECDFCIGLPDAALFPWDEWRRLVARQLRSRQKRGAGYGEPAGLHRTRAAIARHVGVSRSVRAGPDDVLITRGAQQALDLVGRLLVEPGTTVAVEDPGYPQAQRLFRSLGAKIVPVPVDGEGLVVGALPGDARLVYVTPSHQFPLGMPMSLERRLALLAWAESHRAAIVEDDYDSEFRFDGRALEPLQSLDRAGRVIYVGTFSKVLLPMLRVGFLIAPKSLMGGLVVAKELADACGSPVTEGALAQLIDEGLLARHVRRVGREYQARREQLLASLTRRLDGELEPVPSAAGLHLTAIFRDAGVDAVGLSRRAAELGVGVRPLSDYFLRRPRAGLALGYGAVDPSRIDEGVRRLAVALGSLASPRTPAR
jgi:GntR family transcriptional regulator/MocR family aminotransferase